MRPAIKRFLVTGLPRSRTAWLAALLTAHGMPCIHELGVMFPDCSDLGEVFAAGFVGISDPSVYATHRDELYRWFGAEESPVLIVDRPVADSHAALARFVGHPLPEWDRLPATLNEFRAVMPAMVVPYGELDDPQVVDTCVRHLIGRPMDQRIFAIFDGLRIEQHIAKATAALKGVQWAS